MANYTADPADILHIQHIQISALNIAMRHRWQIRAVMRDGRLVTAHFLGSSAGNNDGTGALFGYWGEILMKDDNGQSKTIDCLDVDYITPP